MNKYTAQRPPYRVSTAFPLVLFKSIDYKMNSALVVSVIASLLTLVFMYIDSKLFDNPKDRSTYAKNMLLVGAAIYAVVYFMGNPEIPQFGGGASMSGGVGNVVKSLVDINEEMMTGLPDF